ncbi:MULTISPECIES: deoxyribose-phosphate aldolase [Corynebacterium]|uniref:Deoxyribose-phosphate aldolase n=1 Tax=Corynebacterium ramonii TaxID=3026968 RepID=A0ABN4EFZ3_9CORY|nr:MULTISPECIES: deoxyribose-phosphate aldolase [Corynebacterium]AIU31813.1 Deoxyribose-phosphate aldolase [Corynebacterium ramonii FRC0011]AKA95767.1 Deoxyribose-phosphate aldolase [Corynebacterium ulcerans]ESU59333.1 deoxyribose-phosphate aldolase [Corynebacterium ulcerans NCTC 12077]OAG69732.1 2-deoxyribose-5-phosphate aldolase [Corynebacterium ulcerans]STC79377.1 Deoxyribose-phosphate aldolase [Corynebacterium ulcerans]
MSSQLTRSQVAAMIDHTLLKPEATEADVKELVKEAAQLGTYSICISPSLLPVEVPEGVHIATVVGFPSGAVKPEIKANEASRAVHDGAEEVDMVINLALVKEGRFEDLQAEIAAVRAAVPAPNVLKVILETAALDDEQIARACEVSEKAGADFVKTSTGFHPAGGASVHAVEIMNRTVGGRLGIKASGGIRDAETAKAMIAAGATRLGLSASAAVLDGFEE